MCVQRKAIHLTALHSIQLAVHQVTRTLHTRHGGTASQTYVLFGSNNGQPKDEGLWAMHCCQHAQRAGSATSDMHEVI